MKLNSLVVAAGFLAGVAQALTPVAMYGQLHAKNGYLYDSTGNNKVTLRGMSLYWSSEPDGSRYYTAGVVKWLQSDWSVSVIRIPMAVEPAANAPSTSQGYLLNPTGNVNRVETVVNAAIAQGLYVVIDWHCPETNSYTSQAVTFFTQMATEYKNVPNVMWEVWNEPHGAGYSNINSHANTVISAIRNAGNKNLVIVGSENWSSEPNNSQLSITDAASNVAYTLHFYAGASAHDAYRSNLTSAISMKRTVFVTEWGTTGADGATYSSFGNSQTWLDLLDQNSTASCNWDIGSQQLNPSNSSDNTVQGSAALQRNVSVNGNWNVSTDVTAGGQQVRSYLRGKNTGYTLPPVAATIDTFEILTDTIWSARYFSASGVDSATSTDQSGKSMAKATAGGYAIYAVNAGSTGYFQGTFRVNPGGTAGNIVVKVDGTPVCTTKVSGSGWTSVIDTMQFATTGYHQLRLEFSSALSLGYLKLKHTFWTPTGLASHADLQAVHVLRNATNLTLSLPAGSPWTRARMVDVQGRDLWSASLDGTAREDILPKVASKSWIVLDGPDGRDLLPLPPVR